MARQRHNQPIREIPAEFQGARQANAELQSAAPIPQAPPLGLAGSPTDPNAAPTPQPLPQPPNLYAPSSSPNQPEPILPTDEFALLRALYQLDPNSDLRRLLERQAENLRGGS